MQALEIMDIVREMVSGSETMHDEKKRTDQQMMGFFGAEGAGVDLAGHIMTHLAGGAGEAAAGEVATEAVLASGEAAAGAGTGLLGTLGAGFAGAGGLALAAAGGYEIGSFLDEKLGISDFMVSEARPFENARLGATIGAHVQDQRGTAGISQNFSMAETLHNANVKVDHAKKGEHFDPVAGNYVHGHYAD